MGHFKVPTGKTFLLLLNDVSHVTVQSEKWPAASEVFETLTLPIKEETEMGQRSK